MAGSYVPADDAGFDAWAVNFSTLLTADPTAYGEDAASALAVQNEVDIWVPAYAAAIDPSTRTPATVAAKDAARVAVEDAARPVAQRINANGAVSNQQRADLGLTIRKTTRTPIPPPISAPSINLVNAIPTQHKLSIRDVTTPTSKAKPFGVTHAKLYGAVSVDGGATFAEKQLLNLTTKTPHWQDTSAFNPGDVIRYTAEWSTRSGPNGVAQDGPESAPLDVIVI